jgi:hypothetical protein
VDQRFRSIFNAAFTPALYDRYLRLMDARLETERFAFRLAETPLFLPADLREKCERAAREILSQLRREEVIAACRRAIPGRYDTPRIDAQPHFLAVDLGIVHGEGGDLEPRLIELQAFSSLYGMTFVQAGVWGEVTATVPGMPVRWTPLFSGLDQDGYTALLRRTVLADCSPEEVVLLDLDPSSQKTRPDFHATARLLGVRSVCVTELTREGRRLFAPLAGRAHPVRRILHRVVFDELERRQVRMCFDYRDDLDVTWVAHPAWYWIWSKYTLPLLDHPSLPRTWYLSKADLDSIDVTRCILKPIFSFAGQGVVVDVDRETIDAIPKAKRGGWLLQEKVEYAPALVSPQGIGVKAEIRMMFLRPDEDGEMTLAINLVRLSRGKMHGVDHNKGLEWVGSSVAIWPQD